MMIVHYQESDSKGLKAFMRRLFARYKNTSMFSYVVRFLEHAPENTFDALHAIEFLEPGYVDMVIRNHHAFSDNALDHLMYWVGKEYPEYISQANQLFQEIPLDRVGHFLARIPYYDPERQRSIFQVLLNRGVDQEFLDKVRPYFSDLSDGDISSLMRQNQK